MLDFEKDFYKKLEEKNYLKHVLYSDTDSIFIKIPEKNVDLYDKSELWNKTQEVAKNINNVISKSLNDVILKRCNISPNFNRIDFKTEMLFSDILFLDVKKNYSYKLVVKEGKVLEKPEIKYTGIQVVKSDSTKYTQELLKRMIEDVLLEKRKFNNNKTLIKNELKKIIKEYYEKFINDCKEFNFTNIGVPKKFGKQKQILLAMELYNNIIGENVFKFGSSGKFVYCNIRNNTNPNLNGICVPYSYNIELFKERCIEHGITVDIKKQWEVIFTTTCERVFNLIDNV